MCYREIDSEGCSAIPRVPSDLCKSPKFLDLREELERMNFTEVQIEWIFEDLRDRILPGQFLDCIGEFPINHNYGFSEDGLSNEGEKWNVSLSFKHKSNFNYLLVKNK
jgi:hypothetical protein